MTNPITAPMQMSLVIDRLIALLRQPHSWNPRKNRFSQVVKWIFHMADSRWDQSDP